MNIQRNAPAHATLAAGAQNRLPAGRIMLLAALFAAALGCSKPTQEQIVQDAGQFIAAHDYISAQLKLEQFLKNYPDSPDAPKVHFAMAQCHLALREFDKAREEAKTASDAFGGVLTTEGLQARRFVAVAYVEEGKPDEAVAEARTINKELESAPEDQRLAGAILLADVLKGVKRRDEARRLVKLMIEKGPPDFKRHAAPLGWLVNDWMTTLDQRTTDTTLIQDTVTSAAGVYDDYLARFPEADFKEDLLGSKAQLEMQAGREEAGKKDLADALAIVEKKIADAKDPAKQGELKFKKAGMLTVMGDKQGAIDALGEFVKEQPTSTLRPQAMIQAGLMEGQRSKYDAARDWFHRVQMDYANTQYFAQAEQLLTQLDQHIAMEDAATTGALMQGDGATSATQPLANAAATTETMQTAPGAAAPAQ